MPGLQFDVIVKELMDSPVRTSVQTGLFRVNGQGTQFQKNTLSVVNNTPKTLVFAGHELVLRTDKALTVTVTKPDTTTLAIPVASMLVLTMAYTQLQILYADSGASNTDVATIILFQS